MNIALLADSIHCPDGVCPYPKRGVYQPAGFISSTQNTTLYVDGMLAACVGDQGMCGGPTYMTTGSAVFFIEGRPAHRVGDANACGGFTAGPGYPQMIINN